ncbi:alpha-glucoside-specific PTS transporter subunit IIBC [Virgibacillus pantothenticus]|uniref:PTS alpha-glucoside transporter subunit IIBC n=1 Tax=Virgibacillus pantothenticus TaxID=1473 RepID=A0A0L0QSI5_VIRPA|nr:alpha-glucoside-specific PTS transporter subunit IIBC [Virgibacillus pantothenticus]KNE21128.1 PTS alpha-glucoside transporter subunit IIBC [Virgibacillus pantothenticus]MEB5452243.1 alpha-glucoside-specific PTS transporter subunit IIBC [Virgibacillus pantothenticus]MEB5456406.1 alpha-glucoside-specific PTS transporter subunit IIBC [Virgibacillus pantothenticus]MEB5460562.1 alpha-glucoside-specific PTS transporter subunit IIBC [Virgibacillus pantothenticus]MEB5464737.1 alpha-glucoside-speci
MNAIRRFGSAMIVPVLLFPFFGIVVGLATLFKNEAVMGELANPDGLWYQIWSLIENGGWTVFNQMELVFVIGLPISLAKKAPGRAVLSAVMGYLMFNYFINGILTIWGPAFGVDFASEVGGTSGLKEIIGIKTLDTNIIGAIFISAIVIYLHNRFYEKKLPESIGIFQGGPFVVMISFFLMIPLAFLTSWIWPMVQNGIASLQDFLVSSSYVGVWLFHFLERILIPTGLHHFIYTPFEYGPAVVDGGMKSYWISHLTEYSKATGALNDIFPGGGFLLQGNTKMFGSIGIALALYHTAKPEKRKKVGALLFAAALTAVFAGITEPLEFTFLFIAPYLFALHAILGATMVTIMHGFGLVGNMGGGLIEIAATNWVPLMGNHWGVYLAQFIIGIIFIVIYYYTFKFLILKFDIPMPGREKNDNGETKLYTKKDYRASKEQTAAAGESADAEKYNNEYERKAAIYLQGLGGADNIENVTNCATRLRVTVYDPSKVEDDMYFKEYGEAHGVVRNNKSIQVIVGLSVPQIRDSIDTFLSDKQ